MTLFAGQPIHSSKCLRRKLCCDFATTSCSSTHCAARGQALLARCAHTAVQHPTKAESVLVFAGYGSLPGMDSPDWLSDLLLVRLDR